MNALNVLWEEDADRPKTSEVDRLDALIRLGFPTSRVLDVADGPKKVRKLLDRALAKKTEEIRDRRRRKITSRRGM